MKFFFLTNLCFNLALNGFSSFILRIVERKGYTKNLKHAAEEIGLPGRPKKTFSLFLNFANKIGFPGLIATSLKKLDNLNFFIIRGTKSNLPADTAPDVIIISVLDLIFLFINFLKIFSSLSLKMPPSIKLNKKLFDKDLI